MYRLLLAPSCVVQCRLQETPPPGQHILVLVLANGNTLPQTLSTASDFPLPLSLCHGLPFLSTSPIFNRIPRTLLDTLLVSPYLVSRPCWLYSPCWVASPLPPALTSPVCRPGLGLSLSLHLHLYMYCYATGRA